METIPENVREFFIRELAKYLGLFPRNFLDIGKGVNAFPNQEELCDCLVLIVNARLHGMKSPIYRGCVERCLQEAGISHPLLTAQTDAHSSFRDLVASCMRSHQHRELPKDIEMNDPTLDDSTGKAAEAVANTDKDPENASQSSVSTVDAGSSGVQPAGTGNSPVEQGAICPSNTYSGVKRTATGKKKPIFPPAKRSVGGASGSAPLIEVSKAYLSIVGHNVQSSMADRIDQAATSQAEAIAQAKVAEETYSTKNSSSATK